MSSEMGCAQVREISAELALGIADGEERARALEHLAICPECRRSLHELAAAADDLLLLAPRVEPPTGFEARVADAMAPRRGADRRWRRPLLVVGTALASSAVVAVAMLAVFSDDHQLATDYRQTLSEANGSYFAATSLRAPGGGKVGNVFRYEGDPSFLFVSVEGAGSLPDGRYDCRLVAADGSSVSFGTLELRDGSGSYGRARPGSLDGYTEARLVGPGDGNVISAPLGSE